MAKMDLQEALRVVGHFSLCSSSSYALWSFYKRQDKPGDMLSRSRFRSCTSGVCTYILCTEEWVRTFMYKGVYTPACPIRNEDIGDEMGYCLSMYLAVVSVFSTWTSIE